MPDFPWPDGERCALALPFNMDGETVPCVLDPPNARRRLSLISEATYDGRVCTPRILDVLDSYQIKSTFFVPGFTAELNADLVKEGRRPRPRARSSRLHPRMGGSIPVTADFAATVADDLVVVGFGLPDDGNHAPNDSFWSNSMAPRRRCCAGYGRRAA